MRHQITVHVQQDSTAVISWLTGIGAWPFCYPSAVARQRNLESWPNEIKFRNHPSRTREASRNKWRDLNPLITAMFQQPKIEIKYVQPIYITTFYFHRITAFIAAP